jgi:hypothetical protein
MGGQTYSPSDRIYQVLASIRGSQRVTDPNPEGKYQALVAVVVLSNRYISNRFLPDEAIDLVDEAAARR